MAVNQLLKGLTVTPLSLLYEESIFLVGCRAFSSKPVSM